MDATWKELAVALKGSFPALSRVLAGERTDFAEKMACMLASLAGTDTSGLMAKVRDGSLAQYAAIIEGILQSAGDDPAEAAARIQTQQLNALNQDYLKKTTKLAWLVVGGFFATALAVSGMAVWKPEAITANGPLGLILGALISAFTGVVQYYFGSSAGSAQKSALLGK